MINQLALKIAKSILSSKGGYYRGIRDKKVDVPYDNNKPIWITTQKQIAQMYSENGTLFELDIDSNKLKMADVYDIWEFQEFQEFQADMIINMIIECDEQLIELLKQNGYNGMQWDDSGESLICIFDKRLIKDYWKLD